jgi:hypothetical protein
MQTTEIKGSTNFTVRSDKNLKFVYLLSKFNFILLLLLASIFSDFPFEKFENFLKKNKMYFNNKPKVVEYRFTNNCEIDHIFHRIDGFSFTNSSENLEFYPKIATLLTKYNYFEFLNISGI